MAILDLTDPMVYKMANRNHVPEETWMGTGGRKGCSLMDVSCETCGHEWPCPVRVSIRRIEEGTPAHDVIAGS